MRLRPVSLTLDPEIEDDIVISSPPTSSVVRRREGSTSVPDVPSPLSAPPATTAAEASSAAPLGAPTTALGVPAALLVEIALAEPWTVRQAVVEVLMFSVAVVTCSGIALAAPPTAWPICFLALPLHRATVGLMLDMAVMITARETCPCLEPACGVGHGRRWCTVYGCCCVCVGSPIASARARSGAHLVPLRLRALDGFGVLLAFFSVGGWIAVVLALPPAVYGLIGPPRWTVLAAPFWVATAIEVVCLAVLLPGACTYSSCRWTQLLAPSEDPLGVTRRWPRPPYAARISVLGWRTLALVSNFAAIPVCLFADGVAGNTGDVVVLAAALAVAATASPLLVVAAAGLGATLVGPPHLALSAIRTLAASSAVAVIAVTGAGAAVVVALQAQLHLEVERAPVFMAAACMSAAVSLAAAAVAIGCAAIPHARAAIFLAHGMATTPTAAARAAHAQEANGGSGFTAESRRLAVERAPNLLVKLTYSRYREILHTDDLAALGSAPPPPVRTPAGGAAAIDLTSPSAVGDVCVVCCSAPATAVALSCGHGGACFACMLAIIDLAPPGEARCVLCRAPIAALARIPPPSAHTSRLVAVLRGSDDADGSVDMSQEEAG